MFIHAIFYIFVFILYVFVIQWCWISMEHKRMVLGNEKAYHKNINQHIFIWQMVMEMNNDFFHLLLTTDEFYYKEARFFHSYIFHVSWQSNSKSAKKSDRILFSLCDFSVNSNDILKNDLKNHISQFWFTFHYFCNF